MDTWRIVLAVLAAVLVGVLIPVLLQLRSTLRQAERRMRSTGRRADLALDQVRVAAERVNRLLGGLDGGEKHLASLILSAGQLAQTIDRVRSTVNVASAVGAAIAPAVMAMVRSLGEEAEPRAIEHDDSVETKGNGREHLPVHPPPMEDEES